MKFANLIAALAVAGSALVTAAGARAAPETLSFGAFPGSQDIVLFAIADQHFDTKHNLALDVHRFQSVPALNAAVIGGAVQAGFASLNNVASARAQGRDVMAFNALLSVSELVLVPKDSPAKSLSDLKGQKFGSFTGTTGSSWGVLQAGAKAGGLMDDISTQMDVISAPDGALLGLLDQGQLKGVVLSSGGSVPALLSGKYRILVNIRDLYTKYYGAPPGQVVVTSTDSFAKEHGAALKAYSQAQADGIDYVLHTPTVWQRYAENVKITDPKGGEIFEQLLGTAFITKWDDATIKTQVKFVQQLIEFLGAKNFVDHVPDGLFTTAYVGK